MSDTTEGESIQQLVWRLKDENERLSAERAAREREIEAIGIEWMHRAKAAEERVATLEDERDLAEEQLSLALASVEAGLTEASWLRARVALLDTSQEGTDHE